MSQASQVSLGKPHDNHTGPNCWSIFEQVPDSYLQASHGYTQDNFFQSLPWYQNLLQTTCHPDVEFRLYAFERHATPLALLPTLESKGSALLKGLRGTKSLTNLYSLSYSQIRLADEVREQEIATAFIEAIRANRRANAWLQFECLEEGTGFLPALEAGLKDQGYLTQIYEHFGNWFGLFDEGHSFQSFWHARPSILRNTVRHALKRSSSAGKLDFRIYREASEVEAAIAHYQTIYDRSWKDPEPYPLFIPGLIRAGAAAGVLRLGVLSLDGSPIAAQIWIVSGDRATIYKLAHDERFKKLSPGTALTYLMLEAVLTSEKIAEIDFGRGDEPFKRLWLKRRRQYHGLIAFDRRSPLAMLEAARHIAPAWLKRLSGADRRGTALL